MKRNEKLFSQSRSWLWSTSISTTQMPRPYFPSVVGWVTRNSRRTVANLSRYVENRLKLVKNCHFFLSNWKSRSTSSAWKISRRTCWMTCWPSSCAGCCRAWTWRWESAAMTSQLNICIAAVVGIHHQICDWLFKMWIFFRSRGRDRELPFRYAANENCFEFWFLSVLNKHFPHVFFVLRFSLGFKSDLFNFHVIIKPGFV